MNKFDEKLRAMAEREAISTPEGFDSRLQETLANLPSKGKRRLGAMKGALVAAAACVLLVGTAFAASPGLRDILTEALGGFAPYAQEQEEKTYLIEGIEFKVKSVLADDFTIRAYVEARDVEGDIFDKIDDITIPTRVHGGVDVPTVNEWLATDATESWMSGAECLSYDAESRTALLVVSTWKAMPEDMTEAAVQVRAMNSYLTGDYEEVWRNRWGRAIPVEVKPVDTTVLGRDTALVSGLGATPVMEQYIVYNKVEELLAEKGIKVYKAYVGNYFTSLEMMGVTLTVMKLDDELKECIDMPADSVGLKQL